MINAPRDPSTGLSSSNLRHAPVVLRKQVDVTSPMFANALSTNETFETMLFTFVPLTYNSAMPPPIYFVKLSNATIAAFKQYFSDQPSARYVGWQLLEEIAFHYQKIEWGFDENVVATANWPPGP